MRPNTPGDCFRFKGDLLTQFTYIGSGNVISRTHHGTINLAGEAAYDIGYLKFHMSVLQPQAEEREKGLLCFVVSKNCKLKCNSAFICRMHLNNSTVSIQTHSS